jgi:hypothetical protein
MKRLAKITLEKIFRNAMWIDSPTDPEQVRQLITSLRPRETTKPLIRIGSDADGGYLIPDDLEGIQFVVSPGVSTEVGCDLELANRGLQVYMADASVDGPPCQHQNFHFTKKFVGVRNSDGEIRLDEFCRRIVHDGDGILQMDIEGAEYRTLLDTSRETMLRFRYIVLETHRVDQLFGKTGYDLIGSCLSKLLETHTVAHIHPNNVCGPTTAHGISIPPVLEFTFARNDRDIFTGNAVKQIPNPLDRPNISGRRDVLLPNIWWN